MGFDRDGVFLDCACPGAENLAMDHDGVAENTASGVRVQCVRVCLVKNRATIGAESTLVLERNRVSPPLLASTATVTATPSRCPGQGYSTLPVLAHLSGSVGC
jgi:hypothetical protein